MIPKIVAFAALCLVLIEAEFPYKYSRRADLDNPIRRRGFLPNDWMNKRGPNDCSTDDDCGEYGRCFDTGCLYSDEFKRQPECSTHEECGKYGACYSNQCVYYGSRKRQQVECDVTLGCEDDSYLCIQGTCVHWTQA
ncbi:uncharacterized protein LOC142345407 isoform X1 [Convolutriloba macropyga]|uniref:uncharacterized protein LOC142345407 isoform X1 n=1 Tax=Convolutriloba macropyga TaxID=536237 RepID=UPI003F525E8C